MNTKLLNVVSLDGGVIIKKGASGGGGVTINNQSKSVDITENGNTEIRYDAGYTGLEKVSVNVNVVSDNDIAETDAGICRALYEAGLCANPSYITRDEASIITEEQLENKSDVNSGFFESYSNEITSFNGFKYFTSITKIERIFSDLKKLKSITLPESIQEIAYHAFRGCIELESINIPSSVTKIEAAFDACVKLSTIYCYCQTAPSLSNYPFGRLSNNCVGASNRLSGVNKLYVPANATGYDVSDWTSVLLNPDMSNFTIKYQGEINNQDKSIDIVENGTTEIVADSGYTGLGKVTINTNVASSGGGGSATPKWTGHADAEGLRAIGWTDEDIAYYQEHGVNWNAEDDEYHKVTDDNKALYGVLTANNIKTYADRIVYLPKIDTSRKTSMYIMFNGCRSLVSIPQLDTQNVTSMDGMFNGCYSLVSIPQLDTQNVTSMSNMFSSCYSLVSIPQLDTQKVTSMSYMFGDCYSLVTANLKNAKLAYQLNNATKLSKESLLYIINNEAATSSITIKLSSYAYTRLANDADVVAALANHPNISISQ